MNVRLTSLLLGIALLPVAMHAQPPAIRDVRNIQNNLPSNSRTDPSGGGAMGTHPAVVAMQDAKAVDRLELDAELIKKYATTIKASDLEAHLAFLASDEVEGRETGTRGQKIAARYLATQMQRMGLQPGNEGQWYQTYDLNRVTLTKATVSLTGKDRLEFAQGFVCFSKAAMATPVQAEYAFAGYGIEDKGYDNLKGLNLKGKVAVVLAGEPRAGGKSVVTGKEEPSEWAEDPELKAEAVERMGAAAMLLVVPDEDFKKYAASPWLKHMMESPSLRLAYLDEKDKPLPTVIVSTTTANTLLKKVKTSVEAQAKVLNNSAEVANLDFGKLRFDLSSDAKVEVIQAENVLGLVEGTDLKNEVVIVTAHYDHLGVRDGVVFNGADDDGSGTVALLEVAEAFMAAVADGHRPRRSILFMPVSGEEKGLLGSRYYVDHPVYPLKKTVCDLNVDMIGRVDEAHKGEPQYIYIIGSDKLSSQLHAANEKANTIVGNLELDYTFNSPDDPNRFYYRSDHYNFAKNNIPVIFYFSGVHEDYHKATDDIEKILFPRAARVAQLMFATAWDAANRNEKLVVDKASDFK